MVKAKLLFFYVISISLVLVCMEMVSYFAVVLLQEKGVFYKPVFNTSYENYLSIRDPLLGWPAPGDFGIDDEYDLGGSRIIPAFPYNAGHENCISLYGDSFTWSDEVDQEHAWGNVLATLVNCRVANYGVGGYGTDQAYLRFMKHTKDSANIVFLNHLSENILRNVNQFRGFLAPGDGLSFKPRFVLNEEGSLDLIPLSTLTASQYDDFVLHPDKYLNYEYFIPGGQSGVSMAGFPYTISVVKGFRHFHVKARLRDETWYLEFYKKDHPSRGLEVTAEILESFHKDAIKNGKVPIVTIIPTGLDLLHFQGHGVWSYASLIEELSLRGVSVFNFGEGIMRYIDNNDPCQLFDHCSQHYNEKGYEILAKLAYELLQERQLSGYIGSQNTPGEKK